MLAMNWLRRWPLFWRLQFISWTVFTILIFLLRTAMTHDVSKALTLTLLHDPLAFGLSILLRSVYRRVGSPTGFYARTFVFTMAMSLAAAALNTVVLEFLTRRTGFALQGWSAGERTTMRFVMYWLLFSVWSFLYFWLRAELAARQERARVTEAETSVLRSELNFLRAQLDPHFLFNSLNGIAAEIPVHPAAALGMVRELGSYLRYSLDHRHDQIVPLHTELDAMAAYLRIEQARFGDDLRVSLAAGGAARQRPIAAFLLQPLVENAVKHALKTSEPPWNVTMHATQHEDSLRVVVSNTGALARNNTEAPGTGVGLQLLRRRLELLYPERHRFDLRQKDDIVEAELTLDGAPCCG
jgi:two-component system, LytTR family, sensor kinase